jgi:coniferyl-aldehyde dehydrogenase
MNAYAKVPEEIRLSSILASQREAFRREGAPTLAKRRADLLKLKNAILARRKDYETAINADFSHRAAQETAIMEIMPTVQGIDYLRTNLRRWMRPRSRHVALQFRPATAKVLYQPLGVIGILSPWNYPAGLCLMPLATAIAAGNRAVVKPSEFTPKTSALMAAMLSEIFSEEEVAVVTGGSDVGAAFSALPFDHIVFTGSTEVGRAVMKAASENLVPVTLELGGKSPVIIERGFPLSRAAKSIVFGKLSNAGQTCVAPDYVLAHESEVDAFVAAYQDAVRSSYPGGAANNAYGAIISQHHYERLAKLVDDAGAKGARIIEIGDRAGAQRVRTIPPTVIVGATTRYDRHAAGDLRADPTDYFLQGVGRRHCLCERACAAARTLHLQRSPQHDRTGLGAHDKRQCDGQRHLAPLRAGRSALRRRRTKRHGRLPW